MKKHNLHSRIGPREIIVFPKKQKEGSQPDAVLRLAQNSRRIPSSSFVPRSSSSIFLSCALFLNKILTALISLGRRKRNLYEELENTINRIEEGAQKTDEKLLALKNRAEKQREVSKNQRTFIKPAISEGFRNL
jgi:hypothetical protein